jgi:hypothetical protein
MEKPEMFRYALPALLLLSVTGYCAEETIRGVLEKTVKAGACAQIRDSLGEIYYIVKNDDADKLVAPFAGKNIKVILIGTVEQREGDPEYLFNLKSANEVPKDSEKNAAAGEAKVTGAGAERDAGTDTGTAPTK